MELTDVSGTTCKETTSSEEDKVQTCSGEIMPNKGESSPDATVNIQNHPAMVKIGKRQEEDMVDELLNEWNGVEQFQLKTFFIILFSAFLSFFDFFSDGLLGIRYLQEGLVFDSLKTDGDFIDANCTALDVKTYNFSDYIESRQYKVGSYTCSNYNLLYGIATIAITFLPGIQWHAYLKTQYNLGKFLSSIFFPIFMVIFQVNLLSEQFQDALERET